MFNRANKMTALLVAAAAVVSLVPATGVNAADVKRISSEDGKVYHAVAYKDGQFYLDGEVNDKDEANYLYANGKLSELDKLDSNSETESYGEKYVNIEDGKYFVDLTNGKVTDDNIKEDDADDAGSNLRKKIKDDTEDRYDENDVKIVRDEDSLSIVPGNKFGETWYEAEFDRAAKCVSNGGAYNQTTDKTTGDKFVVYADAKGNYIDANHNLGSIKVKVKETSTTSSSVTIENTDKEYKVGDSTKVKASITHKATLGQDSKFIYRFAELNVDVTSGSGTIETINGKTGTSTTLDVIQKISKDQASGDVDGAKYAKTVSTYVVSNDKAEKDTDENEFLTLLKSVTDIKSSNYNSNEEAVKSTTVNGKIIVYKVEKDGSDRKVIAQVAGLKTSGGWYYTDCEEKAKEDVEYCGDNGDDKASEYAVDVDIDGNLWRIDGGFIYKFDNKDDWDKVYKVDGAMDKLSVYNKDNIVAWNDDDEVYSLIGSKEDKEEEEKPEVEVKTGWSQAADGTWTFVNADNTKATGWFQDGANWYLANAAGIMQTEWQTVNGTWFYLGSNGAMQTGWQNINGAWYYLNPVSDGTRGAMKTGWINDNGTWYFADGSGKMLANTTVGGYVLGANGAWIR